MKHFFAKRPKYTPLIKETPVPVKPYLVLTSRECQHLGVTLGDTCLKNITKVEILLLSGRGFHHSRSNTQDTVNLSTATRGGSGLLTEDG
jgi:hypothetical protein